MSTTVPLRALALGSTIKFGALVIASIWIPIGMFFGLAALVGLFPVTINGTPTFGVKGLLGGLVIGIATTLISTGFFALGALIARKSPWVADQELKVLDEYEL